MKGRAVPRLDLTFTDPDEPCRQCGGSGQWIEPRQEFGMTAAPIRCIFCNGSGLRTVRLVDRPKP